MSLYVTAYAEPKTDEYPDILTNAITPDGIIAAITGPDATPELLTQTARYLREHRGVVPYGPEEETVHTLIASSPNCTDEVADAWTRAYWYFPRTVIKMIGENLPVSPAAVKVALKDRYNHDAPFRLKILKGSPYCTPDVVAMFSDDWRVTVLREVAKHPMLTAENGQDFITHPDAKCRANVISQPWMSDESLYLLRDDANKAVSKAAKAAIAARGLSEEDELDAVMDDEVSLFFLAASEDPATLRRIGASHNATEEAYRAVAAQGGEGAMALARNPHVPATIIEEMSLAEADHHTYNSSIRNLLAAHPNNTVKGVEALIRSAMWDGDTVAAGIDKEGLDPELVDDRSTLFPSQVRIKALKTGHVSAKSIETMMRWEKRVTVYKALMEYAEPMLTDSHILKIRLNGGSAAPRATEIAVQRGLISQ